MEYQFKIQIKDITKPPIWRKIIVPADFTFQQFHCVIQTVFGWGDYHLFEFTDKAFQGSIRISIPSEDDFNFCVKTQNASEVKLSEIFTDAIDKFLYLYDFGDNWMHEITLEAVSDDKHERACCLSGKGNCPPEDCGGSYGYETMKNVFATMPGSKEADEYREWLGLDKNEIWDTFAFDIDGINADLKTVSDQGKKIGESYLQYPQEVITNIAEELDGGMICFLNTDTMEFETVLNDLDDYTCDEYNDLYQEVYDEINNWEHSIQLVPPKSYQTFKMMERFIEDCVPDNDVFKSHLWNALSKRKPFKNFKSLIDDSEYRQCWFDFKQAQMQEFVLEQLLNSIANKENEDENIVG